MTKQLGMYIDSSVCIGCKACQIACKDKNNLEPGRLFRRVYEVTGGEWVQQGNVWQNSVFAYNVSLGCMHCQQPACLEVCPTGATFKREDGIVMVDQENCIGCRYCEWACPYDARQFNEKTAASTKCDFCADLLDKGELPACVAACPMRALEVGELSALQAKYGKGVTVFPLPDPNLTQPSIIIKPHKDAALANSTTAILANPKEV